MDSKRVAVLNKVIESKNKAGKNINESIYALSNAIISLDRVDGYDDELRRLRELRGQLHEAFYVLENINI